VAFHPNYVALPIPNYPSKEVYMCEGEEALMEVIEKLQNKLSETHFALGKLTSDARQVKEKYKTYWSTLSPDAVPRPDMIRNFDTDMNKLIEGTFNG
jgi:hypothetical protein